MVKIERFEDIEAWQLAREMVKQVYQITNEGKFSKDFGLRDQIRRAAGSVQHNIAEGFDSGSDAEFARFLRYSLRSASETQSQLYTALDQNYISKEQFNTIYQQANKIKQKLHGFIGYLVKSKKSKNIREDVSLYKAEDGYEEF